MLPVISEITELFNSLYVVISSVIGSLGGGSSSMVEGDRICVICLRAIYKFSISVRRWVVYDAKLIIFLPSQTALIFK